MDLYPRYILDMLVNSFYFLCKEEIRKRGSGDKASINIMEHIESIMGLGCMHNRPLSKLTKDILF